MRALPRDEGRSPEESRLASLRAVRRDPMKLNWKTIAPLVVWLVIYLLPIPAGLNANQWHYFAVFAAVIIGLILESMPVGAIGLIGLTVAGVLGYVDPDPGKSLRWMLAG